VMLGDDLMKDDFPLTQQLMMDYEETQASAVAVLRVPENETSKYGIIDPKTDSEKGRCSVKGFVEKPEMGKAPSNLAIIGRYL
ncbi:sugar phosphate nucleotidyltransferase, partial [Enterococcus faecium]|uniref:sugar phosphate nucleotidyltransferase n=1 Tax=Enterococcus faecium TaxID=1352 RepID=UPI003CC6CEE2